MFTLMNASSHVVRNLGGKKLRGPPTDKQQGTEAIGPTHQDELGLADNHRSELGCRSSPLSLKVIESRHLDFSLERH